MMATSMLPSCGCGNYRPHRFVDCLVTSSGTPEIHSQAALPLRLRYRRGEPLFVAAGNGRKGEHAMERITVTIEAAEALRHLLDDAAAAPEQTLRLVTDTSGDLGLDLDTVREGDQVVEDGGQAVLVIAHEVALAISGATIDVMETDDGKMLTILPPEDSNNQEQN